LIIQGGNPQGWGTLLVKGHSSAPYFWNEQEKTKQTMLGDYLNTGDKYTQDEAGYLYFVGWTDDILKVGGIWVSPIEVEACILENEAVLECAVVSFKDKESLVIPKAYVVVKENFESSKEIGIDIQQYVKSTLAHYKYPRQIEFVDSLPKTATGKIKRFKAFASHILKKKSTKRKRTYRQSATLKSADQKRISEMIQ
jgi:4-hydroxybenzoate-CoA ligase